MSDKVRQLSDQLRPLVWCTVNPMCLVCLTSATLQRRHTNSSDNLTVGCKVDKSVVARPDGIIYRFNFNFSREFPWLVSESFLIIRSQWYRYVKVTIAPQSSRCCVGDSVVRQVESLKRQLLRWVDLAGWFCPPGDKLGGRKHLLAQTTFRSAPTSSEEVWSPPLLQVAKFEHKGSNWHSVEQCYQAISSSQSNI